MAPDNVSPESDASMRARLVESLSNSFPGSALSMALQTMTEDAPEAEDVLSRSCFAELRLERGHSEDEDEGDDDDLTSLAWLQQGDLLKSMQGDDSFNSSVDLKENTASTAHPPHVPYNPQKHVNSKPPYSFSCLIFMAIEDAPMKRLPVKEIYGWMMTRFPYFENAPTGWKNSVRHNLSLNKCFKKVDKDKVSSIGKGSLWMIDPDFRPNLLQALRKTPYHPFHQLQMMSSPMSPNAGFPILSNNAQSIPWNSQNNVNRPAPHLFPFLSKRLSQSKTNSIDSDIDVANTLMSLKRSAESRRPLQCRNGWSRGARSRSPSPPEFGSEREKKLLKERYKLLLEKASIVCTDPPTADHTYSLTPALLRDSHSPPSSIDGEYDFGERSPATDERPDESCSDCSDYDESEEDGKPEARHSLRVTLPAFSRARGAQRPSAAPSWKRRRVSDEEQVKIEEGADALLNLAGICATSVPLRAISPNGPTR